MHALEKISVAAFCIQKFQNWIRLDLAFYQNNLSKICPWAMNFRSSGGGCIFKSCDISLWPYFQEITLLFHMKIDEHALVTYSHKDIPLSPLWDWLSSSQVIQKLKAHKNMSPPPPSFLHTTLRQKWGEFFKSNIQLILWYAPAVPHNVTLKVENHETAVTFWKNGQQFCCTENQQCLLCWY